MLKEIEKDIEKPIVLIKALKAKYGYSHNEFVEKLIANYKK